MIFSIKGYLAVHHRGGVQEVAQTSAELRATVAELKTVARAYTAIAMQHPSEDHTMHGGCTLRQLGLQQQAAAIAGKDRVPVLTVPVEVRPGARYGELPYVIKVADDVEFVGSVNMPKKMSVIDNFNQVRLMCALCVRLCTPVWM